MDCERVCVWEGEITVFEAECGFFFIKCVFRKRGQELGNCGVLQRWVDFVV